MRLRSALEAAGGELAETDERLRADDGDTGGDAVGDVAEELAEVLADLLEQITHVGAEGVDVVGEARLEEVVGQRVERLLGGVDGVLGVVEVAGDVLLGGVADGDDVQAVLLDGQLTVGHAGFRQFDESGLLVGVHLVETVEHGDDALLAGHGQGDHSPMRSVPGNIIPDWDCIIIK